MNAFHYTPEAVQFLTDLKANNNRDWFAEHKEDYETYVKDATVAFCRLMVEGLDGLTGTVHQSKIFRIYRDVRFAKDKTPYKPYQHVLFAAGDHRQTTSAWFFGLEPDRLTLGAGKFSFDGEGLVRYREAVPGERGVELAQIVEGLQEQGARLNEPQLKRVPSGYDKDHPRADLLRRKGLALWVDLDVGVATEGDLVATCLAAFERLQPVVGWLEEM